MEPNTPNPTVWSGRHPATVHFAPLFSFGHLPKEVQEISALFAQLAAGMVRLLPDGPELSAGLRKLLEAKDCMVRARIYG